MKELEIVAKNVETAIQQGLLQLGLEREDVTIRIKDAGGMFKKAKVVLEYEDKTAPVVEETVEEVKPVVEEETAEPVAPKKVEKQEKVKKEKTYSTERNQLLEDFLTEYIEGLCKRVGTTYEVEYSYTPNGLLVNLLGSEMGKLIGYRGEGMSSLQHILNSLASKQEFDTHIILDIEGYKARREQALINLAKKTANKVLISHKNIAIEPMNSYERRIIHSAVAGMDGITTESTGEGKNRHVVFIVK